MIEICTAGLLLWLLQEMLLPELGEGPYDVTKYTVTSAIATTAITIAEARTFENPLLSKV